MAERQDSLPLRVILVGHSPLESALRRLPEIELIRSRTGLDAIGELSLSDVAGGEAPPVVFLGAQVAAQADTDEALRAMRRVDERVRFIGIAPPGGANGLVERLPLVSRWISEEADATSLRELICGGAPGRPAAEPARPTSDPVMQDTPAARSAAPTQPAPHGAPAAEAPLVTDEGVLAALLTGADIFEPCMEQVRRSLRPDPVEFQWSTDEQPAAPGIEKLPVAHRDRPFGWLLGPESRRRDLATAARWLGHWLAVREQHAQLRSAAFTDPLTGAWNRRYLERFLPMAIDRARQKRNDVTLLLFDIDNFKHYNDTYGHPAGDEILIETVRLLNSVIRPTDRVIRIGGDEFAVVFDDPEGPRDPRSHHPDSIFEIAKRFQRQIVDHRFPKLGECARGSLTISGGLATFPWDASDAASLMERADRLILDSKRSGKNVICIGPGAQQALGGCPGNGNRLSPDFG